MTGPVNNSLVKLPITSALPTLPTVTPQLSTPMLGSIMTQTIAAGSFFGMNGEIGKNTQEIKKSDTNTTEDAIASLRAKIESEIDTGEIAASRISGKKADSNTNTTEDAIARLRAKIESEIDTGEIAASRISGKKADSNTNTTEDAIASLRAKIENELNSGNSIGINGLQKPSSLENDPHIIAISDIPKTEKQKFISFANSQYQNALDEFNILCKQAETTGSRIEHKGDSVLHYDKNNTLLYESKDIQNGSKFGTIYKFSYDKDSTAVVYYEGLKRTKVEITTPKGTVTLTDFDADGEFQSVNGTMDGKTFSDINIDF